VPIQTKRSGARTGSGSSTNALIKPNTLVVAPRPSVVTRINAAANPGLRRIDRTA
jgi:hypothetical protein